MRLLALGTCLVLAGCGITPQRAMQVSDYEVCRLSMTPASGEVAHQEARRRGLDCRPYYGAIAAQNQAGNDAVRNFIQATQPPPRRSMNCTSRQIGNTVRTYCD
jgi:hypothetical protein